MIIWLIIILLEAYRNWHIIEVQKFRPNYLQSFILRGIVAIFHGIYMGVTEPANWYPVLIFQVSSFWLLFDLTLNVLRGKSIFYKGKNSGWLDKLPLSIYWTLKAIVLISLIYILI
jgi:hypothetical protein